MTWPTSKYNFDKRVAHESREVSTRKTNNPCKSWNVKLREVEPRHEKKTTFCICENKDADQLRGDRKADQRLCFRIHRLYNSSTC